MEGKVKRLLAALCMVIAVFASSAVFANAATGWELVLLTDVNALGESRVSTYWSELSYEALSELATTVALDYDTQRFNSFSVKWNSTYGCYFIVARASVDYILCNQYGRPFFALSDSTNPAILGPVHTALNQIVSYVDQVENYLSAQSNKLDTIIDLLSNDDISTHIAGRYGADARYVTLPYDVAASLVAELNATMPGRTMAWVDAVDGFTLDVTFVHANLSSSGGALTVNVETSIGVFTTGYLCNEYGMIYTSEPKTDYTSALSSILSAVDGLEAGFTAEVAQIATLTGYVDSVEETLQEIVVALTSHLYTEAYLVAIDGEVHMQRTIPYEAATVLLSEVNARFFGRDVTVYASDGVGFTYRFSHAYMESGFIYVWVESSEGSGFACYLSDEQGNIFRYSNSVYSSVLGSILSAVDGVEGYVDGVESALSSVNANLSSLNTKVANTNTQLTTLGGYLDGVEGALSTQSGKLDSVLDAVDDVEGHIDGLEAAISDVNSSLTLLGVGVDDTNMLLTVMGSYVDGVEGALAIQNDSLASLDSTLEDILDSMEGTVDNITNIEINVDNDAYDVFYVKNEDGTETSIVDLTGTTLGILGDMLNFLWDAAIEAAVDDGGGIGYFREFYLGTGMEGGTDLWE